MGQVKDYGVGLDIGTSSIGLAAVDEQGSLLRLKGKRAISVYLYHEGEVAADRRMARTTRRRIKRAKRRLLLLREFFASAIEPIDEEFFLRMKYSSVSPFDKEHAQYQKGLFNDREDQAFYRQYPTIYHLRYALMTEHRQFDPREIYLAVQHIIKHRGNFLTPGKAADFKATAIDFQGALNQLTDDYSTLNELGFDQVPISQLQAIVLDSHLSRADRKRQAIALIQDSQADSKATKTVVSEVINAILGLSTKMDVLLEQSVDDPKSWKLTFDSVDDFLEANAGELSDERLDIVTVLQSLYRGVLLTGIMPDGHGFSESKVAAYEQHAKDLKLFKQYLDLLPDAKTKRKVRAVYDHYISGDGDKPVLVKDDFEKQLQTLLKKYPNNLADQLITRIEAGNFMPKQRVKDNGAIPYQVHQRELDQIIANQAPYYDWLAQPNEVVAHRSWAPYQLDELLTFRLPYYNGPAITADDQSKSSGAQFAWMVRKPGQHDAITPWNYDQQVDRMATAEQFIRRMQTDDTYLIGENALPKQSLLYQRYEVLNELNVIRVDSHRLTRAQKQGIVEHVFNKYKAVRVKYVQDYLVNSGSFETRPQITGLANDPVFLSSLGTFHELKPIFGQAIFDQEKRADIERIIEWATIFEDNQILVDKLREIDWLTDEQRQALSKKRYRGWGQLSRRLLTEMKLSNGHSIIDELWDTQKNLMQLLADEGVKQAIDEANADALTPDTVEDILAETYTSPSNKKAIRKAIRLVEDVKQANGGHDPKWLFIETADGPSRQPRRTHAREHQLQEMYFKAAGEVSKDVNKELQGKIKSGVDFNTRLFLYFSQNGLDLYTGKKLNIDELSSYDIDHIIPQAITKDDSLNNRVLVSSIANREKADRFAGDVFAGKQMPLWRRLTDAGLLSKTKLFNLSMHKTDFSKYAEGFIARQLVETRQIIKLCEQVFSVIYPETKVIAVKAKLTQQFRHDFGFPKNRDVNDYHHGFDALIAAWVGMYLLNRYPKLSSYFVYGDYTKADTKKLINTNFIGQLKADHGAVFDPNSKGEIIWGGPSAIENLRRVYAYKRIPTVHEVYTRSGSLFKQTLYSRNSSKKLIPSKQDRPTEIYGGYTSEVVSYLAIAKVTTKKETNFHVLSVPVRHVQWLKEQQQNGVSQEDALLKLFKTKFDKSNILSVEIVLPHVAIDTLFWNSARGYFMLGSATEFHSYQQLWLPKADLEVLDPHLEKRNRENQPAPDQTIARLDQTYTDIVQQTKRYFNLYDIRKSRQKLATGESTFQDLKGTEPQETIELKRGILTKLLIGLHSGAGRVDLSEIGVASDFGRLGLTGGIKLDQDTQIIYQSPSGLFERRVPLDNRI